MGARVYWRNSRIGVGVRSVDSRPSRSGLSTFLGNDREGVKLQTASPNFLHEVSVVVSYFGAGWNQVDLHDALDELEEALILGGVEFGGGPLVWVKDDTHTTTTVNEETAGTGKRVEVVGLAALSVSVGDWVLLQDTANDVAVLTQVDGFQGSPADSLTLDLDATVAAGATVWKCYRAYSDAVFDSADKGTPPEQAMDHVRPVTVWRFFTGERAKRSAAP